MQDKSLDERLQESWKCALKDKNDDSKIYSFFRSKIKEVKDKDEYEQLKVLATIKFNNFKLLKNLPKESTLIPKIIRENELIDLFLPKEATKEEVEQSILNLLSKNTEINSIMKLLKPIYGGRFSKLKATQILIDILNNKT